LQGVEHGRPYLWSIRVFSLLNAPGCPDSSRSPGHRDGLRRCVNRSASLIAAIIGELFIQLTAGSLPAQTRSYYICLGLLILAIPAGMWLFQQVLPVRCS